MYTQIDLHAYSPNKANRKLHLIMCRCPNSSSCPPVSRISGSGFASQLPPMYVYHSATPLFLQLLDCIQVSEVQFIFMLCSVVLPKEKKTETKPNQKLKPANARVSTIHKINKSWIGRLGSSALWVVLS